MIQQLAFALDIPAGATTPIKHLGLDRSTIRLLDRNGFLYRGTFWSNQYHEFQHRLLYCPKDMQQELVQNDEGIALLLAEQVEE